MTAAGWRSWRSRRSRGSRSAGLELDRAGPSYTVDTLRGLAGVGELVLIVGADQAPLAGWREAEQIRQLAGLAVAPRGPDRGAYGSAVTALQMEPVDLSSTGIREALAAGFGEDGVAPEVLAFIRAHGLYDKPPC